MTPKLLLADDSVTIQRVIELTFADENVQVVAVGDGKQAIDRVQKDRPDIVLADVGMPERDGYEVAAFIKGHPQLSHIPVLLLTGAFEPIDEARARSVGCDGVLVKPFEPQMVISRVRDLLSGGRRSGPQPSAPAAEATPAPAAPVERGERPSEPPAHESSGASLEDYFDRLDAALANLTPAGSPPPVAERVVPPAPAPPMKEAPITPPAMTKPAEVRTSPPPQAPTPAPARPVPVPAGASAAPAPAAASTSPAVAGGEPSLAEAFAALLAAEQGLIPAPTFASPTQEVPAISDETIDDIVRRVIARMGDESMRRAVLDAAERLVREEIERIRQSAR